MGILTKEQINEIYKYNGDPARLVAVPFYPVMQREKDTIVIDKSKKQHILYFLKNNDFNKCYMIQTLEYFKHNMEKLKRKGWNIV
jgi:hypothetical protein